MMQVDYKEYISMLEGDENDDEDDGIDGLDSSSNEGGESPVKKERDPSLPAKVEPYGAEALRELMTKRKRQELETQRQEKLRRAAYAAALDIKIFQDELAASAAREGGANPLIGRESGGDGEYSMGEWNFRHNSLPLRVASTGKCHFAPLALSSVFEQETKQLPLEPLRIKGTAITKANYRWYRCSFIPSEQHSAYYCYVPSERRTYYISEKYHSRHVREMEKQREVGAIIVMLLRSIVSNTNAH
jgi:hypothetical protein